MDVGIVGCWGRWLGGWGETEGHMVIKVSS